MTAKNPRIAVVSAGWWATQFHIPSLLDYDGADLIAIVDQDEQKLSAAATHYGVTTTYASLADLIRTGDVDGVVVATNSAAHYVVAKEALDAGLHVMVEKPMVITTAEAWDLVETARRNERHLVVGHTYQFVESAELLRQVVASGELGELVMMSGLFASMVESFYRGQPQEYAEVFQWPVTGPTSQTYATAASAGGGQGYTQVTHPMGMMLHITGARTSRVAAFLNYRDLAVDLADAISYECTSGAVGTMASTGNIRKNEAQQQELRYYFSRGWATQNLLDASVTVQFASGESRHFTASDVYPAHATARHLADLISGRATENLASGEHGARVVEFLDAAYRSAHAGQVVDIDLSRG
ncbi:MAG: Gfo/Idh/MocA family oxidoreductase [Actinomycetales bacterium]|nr:Gfo/Idh/MocA family oxidoreductase [Actinomycetales bacterium]